MRILFTITALAVLLLAVHAVHSSSNVYSWSSKFDFLDLEEPAIDLYAREALAIFDEEELDLFPLRHNEPNSLNGHAAIDYDQLIEHVNIVAQDLEAEIDHLNFFPRDVYIPLGIYQDLRALMSYLVWAYSVTDGDINGWYKKCQAQFDLLLKIIDGAQKGSYTEEQARAMVAWATQARLGRSAAKYKIMLRGGKVDSGHDHQIELWAKNAGAWKTKFRAKGGDPTTMPEEPKYRSYDNQKNPGLKPPATRPTAPPAHTDTNPKTHLPITTHSLPAHPLPNHPLPIQPAPNTHPPSSPPKGPSTPTDANLHAMPQAERQGLQAAGAMDKNGHYTHPEGAHHAGGRQNGGGGGGGGGPGGCHGDEGDRGDPCI